MEYQGDIRRALTPFGSPSSSSSSPAYSSSSFKSAIIVFRGGIKQTLNKTTIAYLDIILVTFLALGDFRFVGNARWGWLSSAAGGMVVAL
jgi:hypothetical protein